MLEWKPKRLLGSSIAIGAMLAILILDGVFFHILRGQPPTFLSFLLGLLMALSLPLLAILGYLLYGLFSLRYLIGRDSLVISWARRQEIIPLSAIEFIVSVETLGERVKIRGLRWPGYCIARGHGDKAGEVLFYSTDRPTEQLLITTPTISYIISPSNTTGFLSALRARQRLGPARELQQTREERGLVALPIWHDWKALGLVASGAVANVGLFAYITARYPSLPGLVPLLSEAGQVKLIGTKEELFEMPIIGLVVFLANTILGFVLHRSERPLTYFLAFIALLVQVLFWSAAISIIR
jgi:hypothetical protein